MFHKFHYSLVSVNPSYLPTSGSRLSSRKNTTCSYDNPSCRTQYRQMSLFPRTIPDWNRQPQEFVKAESLDCFKSRLKSFLWTSTEIPPPRPQHPLPCPPPPPHPHSHPQIPLPILTKYYCNDPNLHNLLSSNTIIDKMMLATLWKKKKKRDQESASGAAHARKDGRSLRRLLERALLLRNVGMFVDHISKCFCNFR